MPYVMFVDALDVKLKNDGQLLVCTIIFVFVIPRGLWPTVCIISTVLTALKNIRVPKLICSVGIVAEIIDSNSESVL